MSTKMRARLASDKVLQNGSFESLEGFRVSVLVVPSPLWGNGELAAAQTKEDGSFELNYRRDTVPQGLHRTLELVATDIAGRVIPFASTHSVSSRFTVNQSGRIIFEDIDEDNVFEGDFIVREAEAKGFAVTLGTGQAQGLSHGNAVTLLADKDVFAHVAARIRDAQQSIMLSQLTFSLPEAFRADATEEITKAIFDFHPAPPDAAHLPHPAGVGDDRPERLLLQAADAGVDIRMLLHSYELPFFLKLLAGAILFCMGGTDGVKEVDHLLDFATTYDEAARYFGDAARPNIKIRDFKQPLLNAGVLHARLSIFDSLHAVCQGASFSQSYVDNPDHAIDAPIRGGSTGLPIHDGGIGVTGPAVADLHKAVRLFWNVAASNDQLTGSPSVPPQQTTGGDAICSMQIVRTLSEDDRFGKGEKGILEAYLRAIAEAREFIYLENQYFTNDRVGDALVDAMKRHPHLQVIVLLNIRPDVPFYPFKQRRLITRIRREIEETSETPRQFGVFTRWTHESNGNPSARMLPIYVHAKVGIVDDAWATIGSANLDGLSLDSYLVSQIINAPLPGNPFREQRAIEVNSLLFKKLDGQPESNLPSLLRRKLWAEHLGFSDPNDDELMTRTQEQGGWLRFWSELAASTLQQLRNNPSLPLGPRANVLPWPLDNTTHKTPRDHLRALGIRTVFEPGKLGRVVALKSTRRFIFEDGNWDPQSKAEMDFDD